MGKDQATKRSFGLRGLRVRGDGVLASAAEGHPTPARGQGRKGPRGSESGDPGGVRRESRGRRLRNLGVVSIVGILGSISLAAGS